MQVAAGRARRVPERVATTHLALEGDLALAEPKALRHPLIGAPARYLIHARRKILKIPPGWDFATDVVNAWDRLQGLPPA